MFSKLLLSTYLFLFSILSFAYVQESPVPGGVKKITLSSKSQPLVKYKAKRVAVIKDKGKFIAVVGIPLSTPIEMQSISQLSPTKLSKKFMIHSKKYRVQKLTIKNTRKVTPLKKDVIRINKEDKDLKSTLAHWQNTASPFAENLISPVRGYITSTFGLQRIYNGIPKSPHTALDIAARQGTPIKATASGRIINIHNRFYTGNTVIIDHGQGLMSLYAHLNSFNVKNGQVVKQGDVIGTVGMTGRVTGPHLHWALYLNQTSIDPLLFIKRKNVLPIKKKG